MCMKDSPVKYLKTILLQKSKIHYILIITNYKDANKGILQIK